MSTRRPTLILHPGYPKTATTTLQNGLFNRHSQLVNIGKPGYYESRLREPIKKMRFEHQDFSEKDKLKINNVLTNIVERNDNGKTFVMSDEDLLGTGVGRFRDPAKYPADLCRTVWRAQHIFGELFNVKVVIGIRRQDDLLLSRYAHAYQLEGQKGRPKLPEYVDKGISDPYSCVFGTQFFSKFANKYAECFGKKNVHIWVFERLKKDKTKAITHLCDFIGIDTEEAVSLTTDLCLNRKQKTNDTYIVRKPLIDYPLLYNYFGKWVAGVTKRLFPNLNIPEMLKEKAVQFSPKREFHLSQKERDRILSLFSEDNIRLNREFDLELQKWGYIT